MANAPELLPRWLWLWFPPLLLLIILPIRVVDPAAYSAWIDGERCSAWLCLDPTSERLFKPVYISNQQFATRDAEPALVLPRLKMAVNGLPRETEERGEVRL